MLWKNCQLVGAMTLGMLRESNYTVDSPREKAVI